MSKFAPKCSAMLEPVSLFPPSLLQKVNFEEQIDAEKLMGQLGELLEKLKAKISSLEAQSRLEKTDAVFLDPNASPQLASALESFMLSVAQFNAVYRAEMALWKVPTVRVNVELGNLPKKCRLSRPRCLCECNFFLWLVILLLSVESWAIRA